MRGEWPGRMMAEMRKECGGSWWISQSPESTGKAGTTTIEAVAAWKEVLVFAWLGDQSHNQREKKDTYLQIRNNSPLAEDLSDY